MKKLIVLVGMQGSGKTTLLDSAKNLTLKVLKPSTERSKRVGEGDDYFFESTWEENSYVWEIKIDGFRYGMRKEELNTEFTIGATVFDPGNPGVLSSKIEDIPFEVITVGLDTIDSLDEQHKRVENKALRKIATQNDFEAQRATIKNCDAVIKGEQLTLFNAFNAILEIISGRGGRLHDEAIKSLISAGCLLENGDEKLIQTASYDLSLGDKYWCQGKYITLDNNNTSAQIPPYSYILVQAKEMANIPRFIAADFDTTVSLFLNGVILSNGPQVDPGYKGALFCMLYNASHTPMGITKGKHFATIQFTTTTKVARGYEDKYQNKKLFEDFLDGKVSVSPGGQIFEELEKVEKKIKGEVGLWRTLLITINGLVIASLIGLSTLTFTTFNELTSKKLTVIDKKLEDLNKIQLESIENNESLKKQKEVMDKYLTKSKADVEFRK